MGEVYRARDSRLDREVAIKVLPAELSADTVSRERLNREAKAISKLSHPHICTLYDLGHQDGIDFLIMELVSGETLETRVSKGPLPAELVLRCSEQLASALAHAHKHGIIHRDLKPSNIILTLTGAKLMDFGLARHSAGVLTTSALEELTTEQSSLTTKGSIVGTLQYMAPEQMEGASIDARTDIFALGLVMYEMLTGNPAFTGRSRASLIAAILSSDPQPVSVTQPTTPPSLQRIVSRCLAKNPDERWQCASDLAAELNWISQQSEATAEAGRISRGGSRWQYATWALLFILLMIGAGIVWREVHRARPGPMYFHASVPFEARDLAMSPDGHSVAIVGYSAPANSYVLWVHEIGTRKNISFDATSGASYPFWSADGKYIGFFADGKLKKISIPGGQVEVLSDAPNGRGGTWNQDNVILFTPDALATGIDKISASGGSPSEITHLDTSRFEQSHRWPMFLPDGKHFLYLAANFSGNIEQNALYLGSIDSHETHKIVSTSANAIFVEPGYLLYMRDNRALVVQAIDPRSYDLHGEPQVLEDDVLYYPGVDRAVFSASHAILVTQKRTSASVSRLAWFDRRGKAIGTVSTPSAYSNVRLSPDNHKLAADEADSEGRNIDIWIHDLDRGLKTRLTFGPGLVQMPSWSSDGKEVLFAANHKLGWNTYLKHADGSGAEQRVGSADVMTEVSVWDWSHNGKYVLVRKGNELWYFAFPNGEAKPLLRGKSTENAQFSPDDRWVAYASNESGRMELYVSPFPSFDTKWQVSSGGGREPKWRKDGKELFYISAEGNMMAVPVAPGPTFEFGSPVTLFQTRVRQPVSAQDRFSYDVSNDGQKFLIITKADSDTAAPLSVLLNWQSEAQK